MRRIDRLVWREVFGPWLFGVAIFTVLIMAGTYLFQLTDFVVQGIDFYTITKLTVLLLPGVMAKTFSMAMLLAALLAFGRLSSDSEIVALRAAGSSVGRIMLPVAFFGLMVSLITFWFNERLVPRAALEATMTREEITRKIRSSSLRPTSYPIYEGGQLRAMIVAKDFNLGNRTLRGWTIMSYDDKGDVAYYFSGEELIYDNENEWRVRGGGRLVPAGGGWYTEFKGDVWPNQIPRARVKPEDIFSGSLKDLDSFSMSEMAERIAEARRNPQVNPAQIVNLEYGYYNKVSVPLAALVFGLVGAPLGIRSHRTGAATGFWLSVMIIFGYMMLANFMAVYAQGGAIPAYMASFTPLAIGLLFAAWAIHSRN